MIKYSQKFVARTWQQYADQSPVHKEIKDFWVSNFDDIPGDWNPSYFSWVKWYNEHKRTDWGGHKSPEGVLKAMTSEATKPAKAEPGVSEMGQGDRPRSLRRLIPFKSKGTYKVKDGVILDYATPEVMGFLSLLGATAAEMGAETPVVTSAYRSPQHQAKVMARNWDSHGGPRGGTEYLVSLYENDQMAVDVGSIFQEYGSGRSGQNAVAQYLSDNSISSHMKTPTTVVDLRMTKDIGRVLDALVQRGADLKVINEKDHYHVKVNSLPTSLSRVAKLYSLIN